MVWAKLDMPSPWKPGHGRLTHSLGPHGRESDAGVLPIRVVNGNHAKHEAGLVGLPHKQKTSSLLYKHKHCMLQRHLHANVISLHLMDYSFLRLCNIQAFKLN
jgi:hypothetical protein